MMKNRPLFIDICQYNSLENKMIIHQNTYFDWYAGHIPFSLPLVLKSITFILYPHTIEVAIKLPLW